MPAGVRDRFAVSRERVLAWAGRKPYRRFADRMAAFRDEVAEIAASSRPDRKTAVGYTTPEERAAFHKKVITKLRANGYRPLK